jgi:predicted nucleic acid-binding protein
MPNNTYIDSSVLVEAIIDKSRARDAATRTLNRISSSGQTIMIPQLVIGETFFQIYDNSYSDSNQLAIRIGRFTDLLYKLIPNTKNRTPAFKDGVLELAVEIKNEEKDWDLDYCDCIIVSHALLDKESLYLYTTDEGIHESNIIRKKISKCKDESGHNLKIRDIGD